MMREIFAQRTCAYFGDSTELLYLRSRMYSPAVGRFTTKDSWQGDYNRPMSYNSWLYVYANPVNLSDPSGHDPWWCDSLSTPEERKQCYDDAAYKNNLLKKVYDRNPDEALKLLQNQFQIKLPPNIEFRFAYHNSPYIESLRRFNVEGITPTFIFEWYVVQNNELVSVMLQYGQCVEINSSRPETIRYFDDAVYITDLAFTNYNFYPDDAASIMIHEAVHAWQEYLAPQQIGANAAAWTTQNNDPLEEQAYDMEIRQNGVRTKLSNARKSWAQNHRGNPNNFVITLPTGVP